MNISLNELYHGLATKVDGGSDYVKTIKRAVELHQIDKEKAAELCQLIGLSVLCSNGGKLTGRAKEAMTELAKRVREEETIDRIHEIHQIRTFKG